jgi:hypothetical protein
MPGEEIDAFFEAIPASFTDPLTGIRPSSEHELSAVLAAKHQVKKLRWSAVPVRSGFPLKPQGDASSIINRVDHVFCEYPLFADSQDGINRWGAMKPDLVFLSSDRQVVTFVECKIDSPFTHSDYPPDGQLSRYIEFLHHLPMKRRGILLICPACRQDWYAERLALAAGQKADSGVFAVLTTWEEVFRATQG